MPVWDKGDVQRMAVLARRSIALLEPLKLLAQTVCNNCGILNGPTSCTSKRTARNRQNGRLMVHDAASFPKHQAVTC